MKPSLSMSIFFHAANIALLSIDSYLNDNNGSVPNQELINLFLHAVKVYHPEPEFGFALRDAFWDAKEWFDE